MTWTCPRDMAESSIPRCGWRAHGQEEQLPPDCVVLDIRPEGYYSEPESICSLSSARGECGDEEEAQLSDSDLPGRSEAAAVTPLRKGEAFGHLCSSQVPPPLPSELPWEEPVPGSQKELEFEIVLERCGAGEGRELGVDVMHHEQTLLISMIHAGLLQAWNRAHPDRYTQPGDQIVEVNGLRGSSDFLVDTIRSEMSLHVRIRRLLEFSVSVRKAGRLGLDVAQHGRSLRILHISLGPFQDWNEEMGIDRHVRVSDHVVEANGVRGTASELLAAIRGSEERVELVLRRGGSHKRIRLAAAALAYSKATSAPPTVEAAEDEEVCSPPKDGCFAIDIGE